MKGPPPFPGMPILGGPMAGPPPPPMRYGPPPQLGRPFGPRPMPPIPPPFGMLLEMLLIGWENKCYFCQRNLQSCCAVAKPGKGMSLFPLVSPGFIKCTSTHYPTCQARCLLGREMGMSQTHSHWEGRSLLLEHQQP